MTTQEKILLILVALILNLGNTTLRAEVGPPVPSIADQKKGIEAKSDLEKYSLASLVDRVLNQSPLLDSFKSRVEEKRFLSRQARALPNPEGSFSGGQKSEGSQDGSLYEASFSQTILFPGKLRARVLVAEADVELTRLSQLETELFLISEAVRLAYDYEVNRRLKEFARKRLERFNLIKTYLQAYPFVSPQKRTERRIVEARLKKISAERFEIEAELQRSLEKLKLYLPVKANALEIDLPWLAGRQLPDAARWQKEAQEQNPELATQRTLIERAHKEKDLAAKESLPDFNASIFYGRESALETERTAGLGLSIPLPIFNRNRDLIQSLKMRIEAEEKLKDFKERELASQLGILLAEIEASRQTLLKYPLSLMTDLENDFKETETEFRKGRVDFLVFVELENEIAETYHRALDAQKLLAEKLATLFALAGRKDLVAELPKF